MHAARLTASDPSMTLPSLTLLSQSILSGIFVGSLYWLLGLGLGLSWGLLRLINLAHFAFAFLAAYLCYQLASGGRMVMVVGKNLGADPLQRWLIDGGFPTARVASSRGFRVLRVSARE